MNSNNDLIEEYTGMTGDIQIKQADVVLLSYPLDYAISTQIARNNLEYVRYDILMLWNQCTKLFYSMLSVILPLGPR